MESFDTVRQELEGKRRQLESDLNAARDQVKEIEADLARVDDALGALTGQKKKSRGRSRSRKKPVPTIDHLQQHIAHVRHDAPFMNATALQDAVRSLVRESGSSLTSFKSNFAEALASSPGSSGNSGHSAHSGHSGNSDHQEGPQAPRGGSFSHGISFHQEREQQDPDEFS